MRTNIARLTLILLTTVLSSASIATAEPPFAFKLKRGMVLHYDVEHQTVVDVKAGDNKFTSKANVSQLRQWEVVDVDSLGVATLELTIKKLKFEQTDPSGEITKYNSEDASNSNPAAVEQYSKLVGKKVRQVQLAANGVEKASKNLSDQASYFSDLPFAVTVPAEFPTVGLRWKRDFAVTLDQEVGNGLSYRAVQECKFDEVSSERLVISTVSRIDEEIKDPQQKMVLMQYAPKGTVTLDLPRGLMLSCKLEIDDKVTNFAEPDSYYAFKSTYTEQLVDPAGAQAGKIDKTTK